MWTAQDNRVNWYIHTINLFQCQTNGMKSTESYVWALQTIVIFFFSSLFSSSLSSMRLNSSCHAIWLLEIYLKSVAICIHILFGRNGPIADPNHILFGNLQYFIWNLTSAKIRKYVHSTLQPIGNYVIIHYQFEQM